MSDLYTRIFHSAVTDSLRIPMWKDEVTVTSKPSKTVVSQSVELSFKVPGDDQARALDIITRIRDVLDDVKLDELSMERHTERVYD